MSKELNTSFEGSRGTKINKRGGVKLSMENGVLVCEKDLKIRLLEQQFSVATSKQKAIGGNSTGENIIYVFDVSTLSGSERNYLLYKRYATILELHEKMCQKFGKDTLIKGGLPELPDKKKFHKENFDIRAHFLQKYFDQLVVLVTTGSSINLSNFFPSDEEDKKKGSNSSLNNTLDSGEVSDGPARLSRTASQKEISSSTENFFRRGADKDKEKDFSSGENFLNLFLDPKNNVEPGVTAEMWSNPTKEGKLTKQGHVVKNWKSRWFILQENKLFYFKDKPSKENPEPPLGVILLGFCTIEAIPPVQKDPKKEVKDKNFSFQILQSHWNAGKDFLIQAPSKTEMEEWVRALRQAKVFHTKECYNILDTPEVVEEPAKKTESAAESSLRKFVSVNKKENSASVLISKFETTAKGAKKGELSLDKPISFPPDSPSNILFTQDDENKTIIKGGTLEKLLEKLIDIQTTDVNYMNHFLLTYRTFIAADKLLTLLIKVFDREISLLENKKAESKAISPVILRITKLIQQWIDLFFDDFRDDHNLSSQLIGFVDDKMAPRLDSTANLVKKAIEKQLNPSKSRVDHSQAPPPILPSLFSAQSFDLIDLDPTEVARQLCLLEFQLFTQIRPRELLKQAWTKKDAENRTPNIIAITKRFNRMSFWVTSLIVKLKDLKTRAALLKRFIEIASKCLELRNYNSAVEILSGLGSASVHRLYKTWDLMDQKTMKLFEEVRSAMAPHKSYKGYRERLQADTGACVPYLGVYLSDLTFVDEGNSDFIGQNETLINFEKRVLTAKVMMKVQKFQKVPYVFRPVNEIQTYLTNLDYLDEKETYSLSLLAEPRQVGK